MCLCYPGFMRTASGSLLSSFSLLCFFSAAAFREHAYYSHTLAPPVRSFRPLLPMLCRPSCSSKCASACPAKVRMNNPCSACGRPDNIIPVETVLRVVRATAKPQAAHKSCKDVSYAELRDTACCPAWCCFTSIGKDLRPQSYLFFLLLGLACKKKCVHTKLC